MPYKSDAQRRFMHARHPDIAARWDAEIRAKKKKVSKGWGADTAARSTARAAKIKRLKAIEARGSMTAGDRAEHEHYLRAWRKFTNLQERSNSGRLISPMRPRSFAPLEHQLPGYGGRTGSNWEFNGNKRVRKDLVSKRVSPETRLSHQKKFQAATSLVGGSLGLTGLGLLATRKPALVKRSAQVTTVGAGVGGVGAFNFASIQNKESKAKPPRQNVYVVRNKRQIKSIKSGLEPVKKDVGLMDFGLSNVRQGDARKVTEISKATTAQRQRQRQNNAGNAGAVAGPAAGYFGAKAGSGARSGFQLGKFTGASPLATAARTAPAAVKGAAHVGQMVNSAFRHPYATAGLAVGGAMGAQAAQKKFAPVKPIQPKKPKATIGKAFPKPKNPFSLKPMDRSLKHARVLSTNQWKQSLRADNQYEVARRLDRAGYANDANAAARKGDKHFGASIRSGNAYGFKMADASVRAHRVRNTTAAAGAVTTTAAGAGGYAAGRKKVTKAFTAYNPEQKRQRRLEHTATGLSIGSGATAAGSFLYGKKALGQKEVRSHAWSSKEVKVKSKVNPGAKAVRVSSQGKPRIVQAGTGLRSGARNLPGFKAGLKNAGKAGGLGLTAVGLAVGSDRVRSYRHGRGGSYRQLHRGS